MDAEGTRRGDVVASILLGVILALALGGLALWVGTRVSRTVVYEEPVRPPDPVVDTVVAPVDLAPDLPPPGVMAAFERRIVGALAADQPPVEPLVGDLRIEALDIAVDDAASRPLLRIERLLARLEIGPLQAGELRVRPLALVRPELLLVQARSSGPWNYEAALAGVVGENGAPERLTTVVLSDIDVRDGRVQIRSPTDVFTVSAITARIPSATLLQPHEPVPEIRIASLSATVDDGALDRPLPMSVADARLAFPGRMLAFDVRRIQARGTLLTDAAGTWDFAAPGLGLDARVRAQNIRPAELPFRIAELPAETEASFHLRIQPWPELRSQLQFTDLVLTAPPSDVRGDLTVRIGGDEPVEIVSVDLSLDPLALDLVEPFTGPLPYRGRLTGRAMGTAAALDFDVVATLVTDRVPDPFRIDLTGRAALVPEFLIDHLAAELQDVPLVGLRPVLRWLPLRGTVSGRIELAGPPDRVPLELDVRLIMAEGVFSLAGTIDATGPEPVYDLAGRVTGLDLQQLFEPPMPPVTLTGEFSLVGRGTDPTTADAVFTLDGQFAGWLIEPGDTLALAGELASGTLRLDELQLEAGPVAIAASGNWRFVAPAEGAIAYSIAVDDIRAVRPYIPGLAERRAAGDLRTTGELAGTLANPFFAGAVEGFALAADGWSAQALSGRYVVGPRQPGRELDVQLYATTLQTPFELSFDSAALQLEHRAPAFVVEFRGDRAEDGFVAVEANGFLQDGAGEAVVRRFEIDLDRDRWATVVPAWVRWDAVGNVIVRDFDLRELFGPGRLTLDGRVIAGETVDLAFEANAVPLGPLIAFVDPLRAIEGRLWAKAMLEGPVDAPLGSAEFRIVQATINGFTVPRVDGVAEYSDRRLTGELNGLLEPEGVVAVSVSLPVELTLRLPPRLGWVEHGPLHGAVVADAIPLAVFEGLVPRVRDVAGTVSVELVVDGTPRAPRLDGFARVADGEVRVPELNQTYSEIAAYVRFEDETATIDTLRVRADGWAQASGNVVFEELMRPVASLNVRFDAFRPAAPEDRRPAGVWGDLRVEGPPDALVVAGAVRIDEGTLPLPEIVATAEPLDLDEELLAPPDVGPVVDEAELPVRTQPAPDRPPAAERAPPLEPEEPTWFSTVRLDAVRVRAGNRFWIETDELRLQLSGELTIDQRDGELGVLGTLEGERGTFTLRLGPLARRFDILRAQIRFTGEAPPDPEIRMTARRIVPGARGRDLEIVLDVGGTLDMPTIAFTTADEAPIPESELVSILLFGQPAADRDPTGWPADGLFDATLVRGLTELASLGLEEALLAEVGFPLDVLRIQPVIAPGVPGAGIGGLVFGIEIAPNVFLTVDAGFAALFGPSDATADLWAIRLEWIIDRQWRLVAAIEPVDFGRFFRGFGGVAPAVRPERQFLIDLRRRWTY